jgi:hypothetical protein
MESFHRFAKHLPTRRLLGHPPPHDRISIDRIGTAWVYEDVTLIILKGHLLIEAALVDICARVLENPAALETEKPPLRFSTRLNLIRALLGDDALPESVWYALKDLNRIRNALAHNLEPTDIDTQLGKFFERLDEFEDFRSLHEKDETISERLTGCLWFLCGVLEHIGEPTAEHTDEASE